MNSPYAGTQLENPTEKGRYRAGLLEMHVGGFIVLQYSLIFSLYPQKLSAVLARRLAVPTVSQIVHLFLRRYSQIVKGILNKEGPQG